MMMGATGFAHSTWKFGVLDEENAANNGGTKLRALVVIGSGMTTVSLLDLQRKAMDMLDLVVFIDPYVNDLAIYSDRKDNLYVLPAASQMETAGTSRLAVATSLTVISPFRF